ncbi:MAG TPA: beta-propeller fold lactonase family protein [Verrucomicrobiae bacterium]|nr:beta-propeller fold lactonase family protein [Verrucomicrobiae bacterium]
MLKKAAALLLVGVSAATWTSCGNTVSNYLYAAIPAASEIAVFREDPNSGLLTELSTGPVSAGPGVHALAVAPSGKFLYAANAGEGDISTYSVTEGYLTEIGSRTLLAQNAEPTLLVMDSTGSYLYAADAVASAIYSFSIDASSGALSPVTGSPFPVGVSPLAMQIPSSGNVLYVTGQSGTFGYVQAFSLSSGKLVQPPLPNSPYLTGTNPVGLTISSNGSYLYTANAAPDNSISQFTINPDGSLNTNPTIIGSGTLSSPSALLITKVGNFLFAADDVSSGSLVAFSVNSSGGLTLVASGQYGTAAYPDVVATDPKGDFVFVGNQSTPKIQSFQLNNGNSNLITVGAYPIPGTPTSIVILK